MKELKDYVKDFTLMQTAALLSGRTIQIDNLIFFATVEEFENESMIFLYAIEIVGKYHLAKPKVVSGYSELTHNWI